MLNTKSVAIGTAPAAERRRERTPIAYRIAHLFGRPVLRTIFRFEITGRAHVPAAGPFIVVANHLNWLDAFALLVALPVSPRLHLVGWDGVLDAPKLSRLIKVAQAGFIPVARDRTKRSHQRRAVHRRLHTHLADGGVLALFPEGRVGHVEGALRRFQPGFAHLALTTGAAIVPVGISGTRNLWLRKTIRVSIGAPIETAGQDREGLMNTTREAMLALLPAYRDPGGLKLFERRLTELIPALTDWRRGRPS